jgi:uncharacterized protein with PIN domain
MHEVTPASAQRTSMLADRMLGKLARLLRMVGQDVEYVREGDALEIARRAQRDGRVLLTRDKRLASRKDIGRVLFVENNYPFHQTRQVLRDLQLAMETDFQRCVEDNGMLEPVARDDVAGQVPAYVHDTIDRFYRCVRCKKIYWDGTHVAAMRNMIASLEDAPLVVGDGEDDTPNGEAALRTLEPLVDLHQAMDVLFLKHRLALMEVDIPRAQRMLRRFAMCMHRHIEDERELVLPLYASATPPGGYERGAAPEIFENEHKKILDHLARMEAATEQLCEEQDRERLKARCLQVLDREKVFTDLIEHHDLRERQYLYPALERMLAEQEKMDLIERMIGVDLSEIRDPKSEIRDPRLPD